MKNFYLFLFLSSVLLVSAQDNPNFTLAPNGVTCLCPNAAIGETGTLDVNGVIQTFTKRTRNQLQNLIWANQTNPQIALTCTSGITDMNSFLSGSASFNQDISSWDVSNVTNMSYMFSSANSFNQDLSFWDVSNVTDMSSMFSYANSFNQDISSWDVSNVTNMSDMFESANSFNQPLNNWDVSSVINMSYMFRSTNSFNQPLNSWDVSSVTNMSGMFEDASSFNQPLDGWDVSSVTNMSSMFEYNLSFNQPLNLWDVSSVTNMSSMFRDTSTFDQPLNNWNVSNVINMTSMFRYAIGFNQDISSWCVENFTSEPSGFSIDSPLDSNTSFKPNWGAACNGCEVPINLSFSNLLTDGADVTWDTEASATNGFEYVLFTDDTIPDELTPISGNVTSGTTSFSLTGLLANTTYKFYLRSNCINDTVSNWSESLSFTTAALANPNFTLALNGVTCLCPNAAIGEAGSLVINGETKSFVKRTKSQLENLIWENPNDPQIALSCTSGITNMSYLFSNENSFNQNLSSWDVSNVTNMNGMFESASSFNQPLNNWDVSSVINMSSMFRSTNSFNQPLNSWDVSSVTNMSGMFEDASSFNQPLDGWDVSSVTNMSSMFEYNLSFNQPLNLWDVSSVTNMSSMFRDTSTFDQPLNNWNVSNVINMTSMFRYAIGFNQDISSWCVENFTSEPSGFSIDSPLDSNTSFKPNWGAACNGCEVPINLSFSNLLTDGADVTWDTEASATNGFEYVLFTDDTIPDELTPISGNVTSGTTSFSLTGLLANTTYKFYLRSNCINDTVSNWSESLSFTTAALANPNFTLALNGVTCLCPNAAIGEAGSLVINGETKSFVKRTKSQLENLIWENPNDPQIALSCTSGITNMSYLFSNENSFNQNLSSWDVSNVTNMNGMFESASSFNQPLNNWDVSSVINMSSMFRSTNSFNQPLNSWDVSSVTNMSGMFEDASSFNQPLDGWDVSSVTNMSSMFEYNLSFNQPLNLWDVSSVTNMSSMFRDTSTFDQPLNNWNVSNVINMTSMFRYAIGFNQDISSWCVENFTSEPSGFSIDSPLDSNTSFKPNWGVSCNNCLTPTNLTVSNITSDSADLSWDDYANATGGFEYLLVLDDTTPDEISVPSGTIESGVSSISLPTIFTETTYTVYIRSKCDNGIFSDWSSGLVFSTLALEYTALNFDGTDDFISSDAPSPSILPKNNEPRSVEFSIKTTQTNTGIAVSWGNRDLDAPDSYGKMSAFAVINGKAGFLGEQRDVIGTVNINDGNWHDIAITYDGTDLNNLKIYVDGLLDTGNYAIFSQTGSLFLETDTNIANHKLMIGTSPPPSLQTNFFSGALDNIRIWNIALTEQEVSSYSGVSIPINTSGLIAYYTFEDTTIDVNNDTNFNNSAVLAEDLIGNLNGTLNNFSQDGISSGFLLREAKYWNGAVDTNWNNSGNWRSLTLPLSTDHVVIQNVLNQPFIDSQTKIILDILEIVENANINVEGVLNIDRQIINEGSIAFKSNSTASGQLDEFNGNISGFGKITTERFIPAGDNNKRAYRLLTSAVNSTGSIYENWQENGSAPSSPDGLGTHITGGLASDGFDQSGSNNPSMFTFDNTNANGTANQTDDWSALPNTNIKSLKAGEAYLTFVRGDRSIDLTTSTSTPTNTTLRASGALHTGSITYSVGNPVSYLNLSGEDEFYSLIGNPYQSIVDFNAATKSGLTDFIYVWDASIAGANGRGGYVTVDVTGNTTPPNPFSSDANQYLAPGMSFFVQNDNNSGTSSSLTIDEDDKITDETEITVFNTYPHFYINSRLYETLELQNGNTESDAIGLRFSDNFTTIADDEDATKLFNPGENYAIINNGLRSIDKQGIPAIGDQIDLTIINYEESNYSLTFVMENKPTGLGVFIVDNYLNTQTELTESFVYDFAVDANIPESTASDRFNLIFDNTTLGIDENSFGDGFSLFPNPTRDGQFSIKTPNLSGQVKVEVISLLGQNVYSQNLSVIGNQVDVIAPDLSTGVYVVKLTQDGKSFSFKLIME